MIALDDEVLALALAGHAPLRIADMLRERSGADALPALARHAGSGTLARIAALYARLEKYEGLFELLLDYAASDSRAFEVPRERMTRELFGEAYFHAGRPVVVRGATAHWPAARWTFDLLAQRYGGLPIEFAAGEEREARDDAALREAEREMPFGAFIESVRAAPAANDRYIVATNGTLRRAGFAGLLDDLEPPAAFSDAPAHWRDWVQFWCGPRGTITALHHDGQDVLFTQVLGRKRFKLYPAVAMPWLANEAAHTSRVDPMAVRDEFAPGFAPLPSFDVTLGPGDLLFIPAGWWHWVYALEPSVSVTFYGFSLDGTTHVWRDCTLPERVP